MRVAIYSKKVNKSDFPLFKRLIDKMHALKWNIVLEEQLKAQLIKKGFVCSETEIFNKHADFHHGIDVAFSIGGDGTFLKTVSYVRNSGVPIIGINTGRLGFLANVSESQLERAIDMVDQQKYVLVQRSLLQVETKRNLFGADNFALNEVTILKKDTASMITVHAELGKEFLNSYWVDGMIVSTPTGSTAYNLSCGGPIVTPGCQVHILTPIAPHNLNVRPMVVSDNVTIKLSVEGRERNYLLSLDGISLNIKQKEEVFIRKADFFINLIKLEDTNFLDTIRNKMLWGKDRRN